MIAPNADEADTSADNIRQIVGSCSLSSNEIARRIGITPRRMRAILSAEKTASYAEQYALERLAEVFPPEY